MLKPNHINLLGGGVDESAYHERVLAPTNNLRKNFAFTLAEVLITLGIIGIVAAMVIPSLISSYQKHVTVTRLKQTYAQLSQAIKLSAGENGDVDNWNMGTSKGYVTAEGEAFAKTYIMPYIKYSYTCDTTDSYCNQKPKKNLKNQKTTQTQKIYSIILINGVQLGFDPRGSYVTMLIDINGPAEPNIRGKDVFFIELKKYNILARHVNIEGSGLYILGEGLSREELINSGYSPYLCSKKGGAYSGAYCGALIKLDGWKISKDYPW